MKETTQECGGRAPRTGASHLLEFDLEAGLANEIQTIRQVIERISTRRNRRGESSDTEETTVSEINDNQKTKGICDYCNNSQNAEQKAKASTCPGRIGKTFDIVNGERRVRNPNCRVLIANRLKRELKRKARSNVL